MGQIHQILPRLRSDRAHKPEWLDEKTYREKVLPRLCHVTVPTIVSTLAVSEPYASNIRAGRSIPHPRHWLALAHLVEVNHHPTATSTLLKETDRYVDLDADTDSAVILFFAARLDKLQTTRYLSYLRKLRCQLVPKLDGLAIPA
jgi:hypothetical protein